MPRFERIRDLVTGPLNTDLIRQRQEAGWILASIEWQRETTGADAAQEQPMEDVPYGMRIAVNCQHLEEDPQEISALAFMMDLLINDKRLSEVASELNENGYRTRNGGSWNPVMVFNLFPRLIEMGPRIFSTDEWEVRKKKLLRPIG